MLLFIYKYTTVHCEFLFIHKLMIKLMNYSKLMVIYTTWNYKNVLLYVEININLD